MDINLRQQFIVAQESQPHLVVRGGSYVAITSINGLTSSPSLLAYGVSKAGLISMVRTFALEFGPTGTRYNAIAPGTIRTPRAVALGLDDGDAGALVRAATPLRRLGDPEDVGYGVLYLMSKLGRFVTGHVLTIDGGTVVNYPLWSEHPSLRDLRP
jgi:NAD(P)-dependent dehydrogenase (short-subunit alcohol dehydrogenase family)